MAEGPVVDHFALALSNKGEIKTLNSRMDRVEGDVRTVSDDVKEIKDRLMNRPTWVVTWIISSLVMITSIVLTWGLSLLKYTNVVPS